MRLILLFCLLSLGALPAWALDPARAVSDYSVRSWSMVDGLPHNLVQALAQDEDGLLWIGTWEGIAVFNGHRFRTLPINLPGVGNDPRGIGALLRARDGSMLVGTRHSGVLRYRRGVWQQLGGAAGSKLSVYSLAHGHDGDLWIGTHNGFFRLDREGVLHSVGDLANQRIGQGITARADAQGGVLLGSASGLQRWSPEGGLQAYGQQIGLPPDCPVRALAEFNQGLWIACADGLWMLRHGELKRLLHQAVENLQVDRDGQLWAAFLAGGLLRISQDGHMEHLMGKDRGLSGRNSRGLLEDREGLLWVGTTNGLHRITDAPISGIDAFTGLDDEYVRSILQTRDGSVWVGHSDGIGLWRGGRLNPLHLELSGQTLVPSVLALAEAREGGGLGRDLCQRLAADLATGSAGAADATGRIRGRGSKWTDPGLAGVG